MTGELASFGASDTIDKISAEELAMHRQAICEVGRRLWDRQMVAANDGNISVRIGADLVLCTPSGVSKGFMDPDSLALVNLRGEAAVPGAGPRPSSEVQMHLRLYRDNPAVGAVVHAHPLFATALAVRGQALVNRMLPEAIVALPEVPVAAYATPSTAAVAESIAGFSHSHKACLLELHGALTWDNSLEEAYLGMERLEAIAKLTVLFEQIGGAREIPAAEIANLHAIFG